MIGAVVDTNILIRIIIRPLGSVAPIIVRLQAGKFQLIYSRELLQELAEKLQLPRLKDKHALTDDAIEAYIALLVEWGEEVVPERTVEVCRDPDDNHVIEVALAGKAEYVVTGDNDLLVLQQFETVRFVTPREFLAAIDNSE